MNRVIIYSVLILFVFVGCTNKKDFNIPSSKNDNNSSTKEEKTNSFCIGEECLGKIPVDEGRKDKKNNDKI